MKRSKGLYFVLLCALLVGYLAFMRSKSEPSALISGPNGVKIALIPTRQDTYSPQDIQIKLELPAAFFHQRGEAWTSPLTQVNFALDTRTRLATSLSPLEDPEVVLIAISNVAYDTVDAGFNRSNPRYSPVIINIQEKKIHQKFGLNYFTNQAYPGANMDEYLFDVGPFHRVYIHCKPSGNATPTLCYLKRVGVRGGGVIQQSKFAVMTEVIFRRERLPQWINVANDVDEFLRRKITVLKWEK